MNKGMFFRKSGVLLSVVSILSAAVSCGPSAYLLDIETRQPSASGINLIGKTVSVVYADKGESEDSLFSAAMSSAFASVLEDDYFGGDSLVTVYCLDRQDTVDFGNKAEMVDLLVDTGSDVLFLFDSPEFGTGEIRKTGPDAAGGYVASGSFPFVVDLYVYDSMDPRDTVMHFSGSTIAEVSAEVTGSESHEGLEYILKNSLEGTARNVGTASGSKFAPAWKAEQILFFVYDSSLWYDSYFYVNDYQWQKAMDIWMSMLDTENLEKKACLEYNLSAACYLQGEFDLAEEWLDLSEKHFKLPYTDTLRKKIRSGVSGK